MERLQAVASARHEEWHAGKKELLQNCEDGVHFKPGFPTHPKLMDNHIKPRPHQASLEAAGAAWNTARRTQRAPSRATGCA